MIQVEPPAPEQIEEDLREILRQLGYLSSGGGGGGGSFPFIILEMIGVIILSIILLYFAALILNRSSIRVKESVSVKKKEEELIEKKDYSAFYKKAVEMGKRGEYLEAVRMLYMALLVLLDSKKMIEYHPSLTNFEYRLRVKSYPFGTLFDRITRTFDSVYYGKGKATEDDFSEIMDDFCEIEEVVS